MATAAKTEIVKRESNNSTYLLYNLVSRDFKLKYRRSVLGVVWSILNPLLTMIVMALVFSNIFRFNVENYPVYLILGQVMMNLVTEATSTSMGSIIDNAPLIKKIYIEKIIFPTERTIFSLVNFVLSLVAVAGVMIFFKIPPNISMLMVIPLLLITLVYALGISYLLSAISVFFRDVMHLWSVFCTLWFYLTPVFWPLQALQDNGISWVFTIIQWNPMYHFVTVFRDLMMYGTIPGLREWAYLVIFAVVSLAIGFFAFKKLQKKFILYI